MKTSFFSFAIVLFILNSIALITSSQTFFNFTTDQHALLAFKNSITSDPHGILVNNWSTSSSFCYWSGVSCGIKHQRVMALNVSGFQLGGVIAPHLGNLTFLRSLDISFNNFTGQIPSEMSNLPRLKNINIGVNSFTGAIPSWFGALSQLQHLQLNNNTFSGRIPPSLFNISRLQTLDMGHNFLNGNIPEEISNFSCLETIKLGYNQFTGSIPYGIFNMSSLITIILRVNGLSGKLPNDMCGNTPKLKGIDLSENDLYGEIPTNIYKCKELEGLALGLNHFNGNIPSEIGNLTMLRILSLYSNNFTGELPQELGNLAFLEIFVVLDNSLSGSIPPSIFNISTLFHLSFPLNDFSGSLPSSMGVSLFNLEGLYLGGNRLSGPIPSSITNASKLTDLNMESNSFSGFVPNFDNLRFLLALRIWGNNLSRAESQTQELGFLSSLTNCQDLKVLEIGSNPWNGILPTSIGNLSTSLSWLEASDSRIKGVIPSEIGNLSNMAHLFLEKNQLTGPIPTTIGKLKQLQRLSLSKNQLQGYIPHELCQMSNLGLLRLSVNMLIGSVPECLGELKSLRYISLYSNKLNSTIPPNLWNLRDLLELDLSLNCFSGQLSSQVGNLKATNYLDLSFNQFSGDIPSLIDNCESLETLNLSNNEFGGSIPQSLEKVRGLKEIDLSNNNLSGLIPKFLENLHFLQYFNVSYNKLQGEIPNGGAFINFTAKSFLHNSALCGATRFQVPPCIKNHGRSRSRSVSQLMKYIVPPFISTIFLALVILLLIRRRKQEIILIPTNIALGEWRRISYIELVRGTSSFSESNLLGRGSFGSVFKATLADGLDVAVKVFNLQLERAAKSFDSESAILSSIRHRNLVRVIGCCTNTEFKALIIAYMPNGSLDKWFYSKNQCLDLLQRLKIAIDVALALEYLHHGHTFPIVHCDIKPSNVLLDEDMTAHVADFGISKLFDEGETMIQTKTLATIGYAAPEYGSEGKVSTNGDVYSYGIMLLEMFTQKKPTDDMFNGELSLKEWVRETLQENAISEVVAPGLLSREDRHFSTKEQCVSSIFDLALKCLAISPDERINMIQAVAVLQKIKATIVAGTGRRQ